MAVPWEAIGEVVTGVAAGTALGWRLYDGWKEKRLTKEYELKDNPDRCREHDIKIAEIQTEITNIKDDIREIKAKINAPYPQGSHA